MRLRSAPLLLMLVITGSSLARTVPQDLEGPLDVRVVQGVLDGKSAWFERATSIYTTHYNGFTAKIQVDVAADGSPSCTVASSTIDANESPTLYCAVVKTLRFPVADRGTRFFLQFPKPVVEEPMLGIPPSPTPGPDTARPSSHTGNVMRVHAGTSDSEARAPAPIACTADSPGHRTDDGVRDCFDQNSGAIFSLYQHMLHGSPDASGSVTLKFTVAPDGTISSINASTQGKLGDAFAQKLAAFVRRFVFEKAADASTFTHIVNLYSQ